MSITDTFTRSIVGGWGYSDAGILWTDSSWDGGSLSVNGTQGLLTVIDDSDVGAEADLALTGPPTSVYVEFSLSIVPTTGNAVIGCGWSGGGFVGPSILFNGTSWTMVMGSFQPTAPLGFTPEADVTYAFRFEDFTTGARMKVWVVGESEPGWMVSEDYGLGPTDFARPTSVTSFYILADAFDPATAYVVTVDNLDITGVDNCVSPVAFDVYSLGDATTPGLTYLATLCDAFDKSFRVELDGTGSGKFSINRSSADATTAILGDGDGAVRYVKVRIPEIDANPIFGFFIEEGDFRLLDSQEEGGETLTFSGHGSLAYLDFAVMAAHSYLTTPFIGDDPFGGLWRLYNAGTGKKPGQILGRIIAETQEAARPSKPLPLLTYGWSYSVDSDAATWASTTSTDEFAAQIGESVLSVIGRLIGTGAITIQMSPDFVLSGHNTFGTNRTSATYASGKVRLVGGDNIADGLTRQVRPSTVATHDIVYGEAEASAVAALGDASSRVTREGYLSSTGSDPATLEAVGDADLAERLLRSESLSVRIVLGSDEDNGLYLPGPAGTTNGNFWVGDTITLDTGSGEFDYDNAPFRVAAINVVEPDAAVLVTDLEISAELGSTVIAMPPRAGTRQTRVSTTISASPGGGSSSVPPHTHPAASVDHGALSGLADDDHPQYFMDTDDILSLTTAETDDTLVLAPDGAGGVEFRAETGSSSGRWELAVITGSPPDPLYADGDFLYIFVP